MGKFFNRLVLLTRKNLKVRFSHRCLSFCELVLPFLLALIVGSITSYFNGKYNTEPLKNDVSVDVSNDGSALKFFCFHDNEYYRVRNGRVCENWYNSVNQFHETLQREHYKVLFVVGDESGKMSSGQQDLIEVIMKNVAKYVPNLKSNSVFIRSTLEWQLSNKSEKELELCIVERDSSCENVFAVVVVTNVDDGIKVNKRIQVEYKIRMQTSYDDRLRDSSSNSLFVDYSSNEMTNDQSAMDRFYFLSDSWQRPLGFIQLQALVDRAIMDFVNSRQDFPNQAENDNQTEISLVRMPFIIPRELGYYAEASKFISVIYVLLPTLAIFSLMQVNSEKSSGFKELLRMHGVPVSTQWMAWILSSFIVYSVWTLALTLSLWVPLLGGTNGLVILNISGILYWLVLLLTMMALTSLCYLVSVFFERVWTAASVGLLIWIVLTVVMILVSMAFHKLANWDRIAAMLIPTVAFDFAVRLFLNGGGTLATFNEPVIRNVSLTTLHCLVMLFIDSCIYMILAVYLDNVIPSKYGVSKSPWYFVRNFVRRIFGRERNMPNMLEMASTFPWESDCQHPFESDPAHAKVAVVLQKLRKRYRNSNVNVVDGLSAKMFTGEIYALLGFNGAGKTTTIGMLSGLTAPTGGAASIFDLDIKKDMEEIRRYIGLCPQHNLLYDNMTVVDQVAFFAKLKGLPDSNNKAKELLTWLGMADKLNSTAEQLSGGQKRRVHLAIALIGDTKLAFLDEPTSGLDPESRRGVWDILLKLRGKMTIILTTHDMEEADVLGDRIGIMGNGKMVCSGTSSFLKKYYGVGYNLNMCAVASNFDADRVCKFVREYIPNAKFSGPEFIPKESLPKEAISTISISLPTAGMNRGRLADLLESIQAQKGVLGVDNIGLSLATMNEVFLKVGDTIRAVDVSMPVSNPTRDVTNNEKYEGERLQRYRFWTLVLKRAAYFSSAPFTILFLVLLFGIFLWLSIIGTYSVLSLDSETNPPRVVSSSSLQMYPSPVILLHDDHQHHSLSNTYNDRSYESAYRTSVTRHGGIVSGLKINELPNDLKMEDIMESLRTSSVEDLPQYRRHYLVGASFNQSVHGTNITGLFSAYALHGAPLSLNLISQARIMKTYGVDANIEVVNHPFPTIDRLKYISPERLIRDLIYLKLAGAVILLVIIASLLTSTASLLPTEERLNKGKQLQLMTGTTPFIYWMSMFTWDFAFFSLLNVSITAVYFFAESGRTHQIFTGNGAGVVLYLILESHMFAVLWFSYLVSWATCIKTPSDGFLIVNKFTVVVGVLGNIIRHALVFTFSYELRRTDPNYFVLFLYYVGELSGYILWPVPMHSLYLSMMKLATIGAHNNICNMFPADVLQLSCSDVKRVEDPWFMHSCCDNCQENCFKPRSFLSTESVQLYHDYATHSLLFDIFAMIASGLLSAGVLYFLEYTLPRRRQKRQRKTTPRMWERQECVLTEEDVMAEAARIDDVLMKRYMGRGETVGFIAHNINLSFGSLKAVDGLSFGVNRGECFGLLGVSGAGKTSTFRILTGDAVPTSGNMFSGEYCYNNDRSSYLATMGYCPQFEGIIGRLTGLQMVKLFGALRGIPPASLTEHASIWLDKFGLLGSANKKCAAYSGGMKRRLSVAMALIGDPTLILLDEPTSGVDPAFRRQFWNVIMELKRNKQTILLTSYTMDECEALCTRLGIMVDGQFKCLGNTRHLKSKFGNGYILTIKLKKFTSEEQSTDELINRLHDNILQMFPPCRVQSRQKALIQYQILSKSLWYSDIFREMELICSSEDARQIVEDYSVTETSLEDVFISFAREHRQQGTEAC